MTGAGLVAATLFLATDVAANGGGRAVRPRSASDPAPETAPSSVTVSAASDVLVTPRTTVPGDEPASGHEPGRLDEPVVSPPTRMPSQEPGAVSPTAGPSSTAATTAAAALPATQPSLTDAAASKAKQVGDTNAVPSASSDGRCTLPAYLAAAFVIAVFGWSIVAAGTTWLFVRFARSLETSPVELTTHWGGFGGGLGGWRLSTPLSLLIAALALAIATVTIAAPLFAEPWRACESTAAAVAAQR